MTTYTFVISTEPYKFEAIDSLIEMSKAVLKKGNDIAGIFFFGSGVYNLNKEIDGGKAIRRIPEKLQQFCVDNNISMAACSAWVRLTGLNESQFIDGVIEAGLGDLSKFIFESDKLIFFGTGG